jgi:hypothetical protein
MPFLLPQESRRYCLFQLVLDSHLRGNDTKRSRIHGLWAYAYNECAICMSIAHTMPHNS